MPVTDNFKDVEQASYYQKCRPFYPDSLFNHIIGLLDQPPHETRHSLAVDLGCGSGQTTLPLSSHFTQVIGVDPSPAQIAEAEKLAVVRGVTNVTYRVGLAEQLDFLEDGSVDLVTVGTALHWFDVEKFSVECKRVLRPGGCLAAYGYSVGKFTLLCSEDQEKLNEVTDVYKTVLKHGDSQISNVLDKYARFEPIIQKHFTETKRDECAVIMEWKYTVEGFTGFIKSMSPYQKYKKSLKDGEPSELELQMDRLRKSLGEKSSEEIIMYTSDVHLLSARK